MEMCKQGITKLFVSVMLIYYVARIWRIGIELNLNGSIVGLITIIKLLVISTIKTPLYLI